MIERKIVEEKLQEFLVEDFVTSTLSRVGHSKTELHKTPLGEKIIIHAARPGLIVGSKGSNIKKLTKVLKTKFKLENPQIEIIEVKDADINPTLIAENIAFQLEKFGSQRFKGIGYGSMDRAMKGGVSGIEILVSGKIPSSRARTWRFYMGYLKKCGDVAISGVQRAYVQARLKTGVIGIQVRVMPSDLVLPDTVKLYSEIQELDEKGNVVSEEKAEVSEKTDEKPAKNAPAKKKAVKKATPKKEEAEEPKKEAPTQEKPVDAEESKKEEAKPEPVAKTDDKA